MRTRAAVLRKGGEPWEITELDLDEPQRRRVVGRRHPAGATPRRPRAARRRAQK